MIQFRYYLFYAVLLFLIPCLYSCSNDNDEQIDKPGEEIPAIPLVVRVQDDGFIVNGEQAASHSAKDHYSVTFKEGAQLGVFVVNNGVVVGENISITYRKASDKWKGEVNYEGEGAKYFAYYPYDASLKADKVNANASDASGFFQSYLNDFTVKTDQSEKSDYEKSDLMVGMGVVDSEKKELLFPFVHQMALAVINLSEQTAFYLENDEDYTWMRSIGREFTFVGFKPFALSDGTACYLLKPGTETPLKVTYDQEGETIEHLFDVSGITNGHYQLCTIGGRKAYKLQVGDFYLKDGSLMPHDALLSDEQKLNCVGIVFQTDNSRIGKAEKEALSEVGMAKAHGLVLSLKQLGYWSWGAYGWRIFPSKKSDTKKDCYDNIDGLEEFLSICSNTAFSSKYEAFWKAKEFRESSSTKAPVKTTGWFVPSMGQAWDIFQYLGKAPALADPAEQQDAKQSSNPLFKWTEQGTLRSNLNTWLERASVPGKKNVDLFVETIPAELWTTTEYASNDARYIQGGEDGTLQVWYTSKGNGHTVRCILAF